MRFLIKKDVMPLLAENTMNAQARNMLLSDYLLMTNQNKKPFPFGNPKAIFAKMDDNAVELMPIDALHRIMAVNLDASKSVKKDMVVSLQLTDIGKHKHKNRRTEPYKKAW